MRLRKLLAPIAPEGLLVLGAIAFVRWGPPPQEIAVFVRGFAYAVVATGAVLALRLRRPRLLLSLTVIALAMAAGPLLAAAGISTEEERRAAGGMIALLLPLNLAGFSFVRERGLLTAPGLLRFAVVAMQAAAVWLLAAMGATAALRVLEPEGLPPLLAGLSEHPPTVLAAFGLGLLVLLARLLWCPEPVRRGFFWAAAACLLAVLAGIVDAATTSTSMLYLGAAGLVLVVAAIESTYTMAYRDELTGLPARRALDEALARVSGSYTVAMVDVDHFKQFNDRHGHDVGDQVLRLVGTQLERVSGGGKAYRYGGEEFTILFEGKSVAECLPHLQAVRREVAAATFTIRGADRPRRKPRTPRRPKRTPRCVSVTVSIGAAERDERRSSPDEVVKAADRALYRAKDGGRNRVEG